MQAIREQRWRLEKPVALSWEESCLFSETQILQDQTLSGEPRRGRKGGGSWSGRGLLSPPFPASSSVLSDPANQWQNLYGPGGGAEGQWVKELTGKCGSSPSRGGWPVTAEQGAQPCTRAREGRQRRHEEEEHRGCGWSEKTGGGGGLGQASSTRVR